MAKLTYQHLASLSDESKRYEIIDGDLVVTPSPATVHQRVVPKPRTLLYVSDNRLGEMLFGRWIYCPGFWRLGT